MECVRWFLASIFGRARTPVVGRDEELSELGLDSQELALQYFCDYLTSEDRRNLTSTAANEHLRLVRTVLSVAKTVFRSDQLLHQALMVDIRARTDGKGFRAPGTIRTAINSYRKFLTSLSLLAKLPATLAELERARQLCDTWTSALRRQVETRRVEIFERDRQAIKNANMEVVFKRATVDEYSKLLAAFPDISIRDQLAVRGYLLLRVVAENAQRSGPIFSLTKVHLEQAAYDKDHQVFVAHLAVNKCIAAQGGATLCFSVELKDLLTAFVPIRDYWVLSSPQSPRPKDTGLVFITTTGLPMSSSNINDSLNSVYTRLGGTVRLTPTLMRKRCGTLAAVSDDPSLPKKMSLAMSHSLATHERYYQGPRDEDSKIAMSARMHGFLAERRGQVVGESKPVVPVSPVTAAAEDKPTTSSNVTSAPTSSSSADTGYQHSSTLILSRGDSDSSESDYAPAKSDDQLASSDDDVSTSTCGRRRPRVTFTAEDNSLIRQEFLSYFAQPRSRRKISVQDVAAQRCRSDDLDALMRRVGYSARRLYDKIRKMN